MQRGNIHTEKDMKNYLAFDLGATSGRAVIGRVGSGSCNHESRSDETELMEIHRFPNTLVQKDGHLYWDFEQLFREIKTGLTKAAQTGLEIESVGIDTWGVDVLFLDRNGQPLGMPYAYRDPQTAGAPERFFRDVMPSAELYARTGIQVMNFNTLFQLYTLRQREDPMLMQADKILFLPDALNYMLTGVMATEYTIASTSQLLDAKTRRLDSDLLQRIGIDAARFAPMVEPGTCLGAILPQIVAECGIPQWPVIAVAGHDTASAVAAVHGNRHAAYLSSGTWSLLGVELDSPILSAEAQQMNITNEGGIDGTIRFLKNITGMWLVENLLTEWSSGLDKLPYSEVVRLAKEATCPCIINPDDPIFAAPQSMQDTVDTYCARHGLTQPQTKGEYLRCIFESLAHRYAEVLKQIQTLLPYTIDELHIIGGGSRNTFLNDLTARATGLKVIQGPAEATAMGNVRVQNAECKMQNEGCKMQN